MKKILLLLVVFLSFQTITAQYTEIINSKRPGFSESPYGVGTKVFQLETGAFYEQHNLNTLFHTDNSLGANLFLRYGNFLEKLEINLAVAYQRDNRSFNNVLHTNPTSINGVSRLTLGAKYLLYSVEYADRSKEIRSWKKRHAFDWKRLVPSVGVYVGWNSNFLSPDFKEDKMSFKGAVLLQNDVTDRFVVLTNLIVDDILQDKIEYSYILTATYALNDKWSIFGEHQGAFKKSKATKYQFGVGTAYLVSNNLQVDVSGRTTLVGTKGYSNYVSLGGSWRLDGHVKKRKPSDALEGTKEPFFKRLFKKRKGKKRKVKKIKKRKRRKSKKSKKGTPSFFKKKKKKRSRG